MRRRGAHPAYARSPDGPAPAPAQPVPPVPVAKVVPAAAPPLQPVPAEAPLNELIPVFVPSVAAPKPAAAFGMLVTLLVLGLFGLTCLGGGGVYWFFIRDGSSGSGTLASNSTAAVTTGEGRVAGGGKTNAAQIQRSLLQSTAWLVAGDSRRRSR